MNKFLHRARRNSNNGSNQGGGFSSAGSSPFQQSGNNIFDQLASKKRGPDQNMTAPNMGNNNMPAGAQQQPPANATNPQQYNNTPQYSNTPQGASDGKSASPLDKYNPQSDNTQRASGEPSSPKTADKEPSKSIFDNGLDQYQTHFKDQNIVGDIDTEVATKALQGDMASLQQLLNGVARNAAAMSMHGSARIAQAGYNSNMESFRGEIPNMINGHQISNVFKDDAKMNHPAMKPLVDDAIGRFRNQFPEASSQEIQSKVQEYLKDIAGVITGNSTDQPAGGNDTQQPNNLSKFFG